MRILDPGHFLTLKTVKEVSKIVFRRLITVHTQMLEGESIFRKKAAGNEKLLERVTAPWFFLRLYEEEYAQPDEPFYLFESYYWLGFDFLTKYHELHIETSTEKAELGNEVLAAGLYKKSLDSLEMLMNAQICRELGVQSTEIAYGNLRYRDQKIEINKYKNQSERHQKGLEKRNNALQNLASKAKIIAKMKWDSDTEKKIRIGEMAKDVNAGLNEYIDEISKKLPEKAALFRKNMPKDPAIFRKWIKDEAPEYAKKRGRPVKNK